MYLHTYTGTLLQTGQDSEALNSAKKTKWACCLQDPEAITSAATDANAIALPGPPLTSPGFAPSPAFTGAQTGMVFKTGAQGTGYYPDGGLKISAAQAPAVTASTGMLCLDWWWAVLPSCCLGWHINSIHKF